MRALSFLLFTTLFLASPAMAERWVNKTSNFCLDTDGRAANGAAVRMWNCAQHPNQTWTEKAIGNGSFQLHNRASDFCLDTDGVATNGGQVRMWACTNHPNQIWEIVYLPGGQYQLMNKASGFCLDTDGVAADGAAVRMWQCVTHTNQTWVSRATTREISRTDTHGGRGGGGFELACPNRTFMTGLRARSGAWVDALSPICSVWVGRSRTLGEIEDQPFTGGGGGGESFIRCEGRRGVVVGVQVIQAENADLSVGNINVDCGDFEQPSAFANKLHGSAPFLGESARLVRVTEHCDPGMVAVGIYGNSGKYIDRLGLLCRPSK
jgi:hypothetical protein